MNLYCSEVCCFYITSSVIVCKTALSAVEVTNARTKSVDSLTSELQTKSVNRRCLYAPRSLGASGGPIDRKEPVLGYESSEVVISSRLR